MGGFSLWHFFFGGLQLVAVIVVIGVVAYFVLRKTPAAATASTPTPADGMQRQANSTVAPRSPAHRLICIASMAGGLLSVIGTLSSLISYWCAVRLGVFPTITLGPGNIGTNVVLRFGYSSELRFNPNKASLLLGANLIALPFLLAGSMRTAAVPEWPLMQPNA